MGEWFVSSRFQYADYLANELDTTVSELLGEPVAEPTPDDLKIILKIRSY